MKLVVAPGRPGVAFWEQDVGGSHPLAPTEITFAEDLSFVFNDAKDDLTVPVLVQAALEGPSGIGESEDFVDGRPKNAAIYQLGKLHKLIPAWLDDEVDSTNTFRSCHLGRRLLGDSYESPARAQHGW